MRTLIDGQDQRDHAIDRQAAATRRESDGDVAGITAVGQQSCGAGPRHAIFPDRRDQIGNVAA